MGTTMPAGGPTQDEIMAISLFKLGLLPEDCLLDLGCGTGKISRAAASLVKQVCAVDRRQDAIRYAKEQAEA
ncbi:MAG: methyltransferase domain-containing protein, partial [Methanoregula sp.]